MDWLVFQRISREGSNEAIRAIKAERIVSNSVVLESVFNKSRASFDSILSWGSIWLNEIVQLECSTLGFSRVHDGHIELPRLIVEGDRSLMVVRERSRLFSSLLLPWHVLNVRDIWSRKSVTLMLRLVPATRDIWKIWPRVVRVGKVESTKKICCDLSSPRGDVVDMNSKSLFKELKS